VTVTALPGATSGARTAIEARPRLERARLQLYNPKPGGGNGKAALGSRRDTIDFHFNPKELSLSKSAQWKRDPARDASTAGPASFTGADPSKLSFEMFLDETEQRDGSVAASVEKLLSCCNPTDETRGQKKGSPPLVVFMWGQIVGFPSFISQISVKYSLFTADGAPLRATCTVSLDELSGELTRQNPTSGALSVRRHHVVVAGDSLASLAYREYGDPGLWRPLADYNGIDDPMRLPAGTELLLPAPDDLAASGA
jgi:nucleoid-associated protein YgaU